jgi:predicted TIM-barrel fold metal-dependent hydrolase
MRRRSDACRVGAAPYGVVVSAARGIVDCHIHLLPGRLGQAVRHFFDEHIDGELAYPNDHGVVLDRLAAAGVVQAWHLPYAHKPGVAAGLNRASAELVHRWSGHAVSLVGGAAVHPGDRSPADVVGAALDEHGLRVVKLHCSVGQFYVDDPRLDEMWRLVESRAVPVVVHAGHDASGETSGHELDAVDRVAVRFPNAPIVIAHAGHPDTLAAVALVDRHENVYVDLTPRVVDQVALSTELLEQRHLRVLFGSDLPNTQVLIEDTLSRLDELSLPARTAIESTNAERLLATQL